MVQIQFMESAIERKDAQLGFEVRAAKTFTVTVNLELINIEMECGYGKWTNISTP